MRIGSSGDCCGCEFAYEVEWMEVKRGKVGADVGDSAIARISTSTNEMRRRGLLLRGLMR
jgi:hypothetical protein